MPRAPLVASAAITATAVATAVRLVLDADPFATDAAALLAVTIVVIGVVTVAGILIAKGRWGRAAGVGVAGLSLGLSAVMPLDPLGVVVIALSGVALAGTAGPWLSRGWLRHLPRADGPPPIAVTLVLGLLALPALVALTRPGGLAAADWVLAGVGAALAWGIARAAPAALWAARLGLAPAGIALGLLGGLPGGLVAAAGAVALAAAAWRREVRLSVTPLAPPRSPTVPFPPELVPAEILEAAGYDERGRPKEEA